MLRDLVVKDEKKVVRSRFGVRSAFLFVVAVLLGRFSLLMIVPHFRSGQYGLFLLTVVGSFLMFGRGDPGGYGSSGNG
jgi:hypothetical protein